jgi:hypothetical protein
MNPDIRKLPASTMFSTCYMYSEISRLKKQTNKKTKKNTERIKNGKILIEQDGTAPSTMIIMNELTGIEFC